MPLTDAMLRDPSPNDWPMHRRNYYAHSYSPLDQINKENVGNLSLEWVWNMHEGDSEPLLWSITALFTDQPRQRHTGA